jgi:CPA2 family monovalent cation:H+ antiporter-2
LEEDLGLVGDLALVGAAALIGGSLARLVRLPPIIGYLAAGIVIGPNTPGLVGDLEETRRIADLGVALLMFTIGIRFSPRELLDAGWLIGAVGLAQVVFLVLAGMAFSGAMGLGAEEAFVFGAAAAISSTMIALKQLEDEGEIETPAGKTAVSISLVQDLAAVPLIVAIPALAGGDDLLPSIGWATVRGVALVAGVWVVGRFVVPRVLWTTARWRSRELFLLSVVVLALGTASISALAGLSLAFGAFLAGLLISESELAHRTLTEVFPLREIFAVVFFVAVGMLVEPESFVDDPELVFGIAAIGVIGKIAVLGGLGLVVGLSGRAAMTSAIALGQMGEFSFIFASVALEEGLFSERENEALLGGIVLSMALSPLLFTWRRPLVEAGGRLPQPGWVHAYPARPADAGLEPLRHHIVVCGYNDAARHVIGAARERFGVVVVHDDIFVVRRLRDDGVNAILGDPSIPVILERAHVATAQVLVVAIADARQAQAVVREARAMNERLDIIARGGGEELTRVLLEAGATQVVEPELEAGLEFLRHTLRRMGVSNMEAQAILRGRRRGIGWPGWRGEG